MRYFILILISSIACNIQAQNFEPVISNYFDNSSEEFSFERSDLQDFVITNHSFSKNMELHNVYVQQTHQNIPILNAIGSFAIKQNRVVNFNHSFIANVTQKIETTSASIDAESAISMGIDGLNLGSTTNLQLLETLTNQEFIFESESLSSEVIPVKLMYVKDQNDRLRVAWDLSILISDETHWWSLSIDANTGEILRQDDWMLTCNFDTKYLSGNEINIQNNNISNSSTLNFISDGSSYRAYPLGVESPNHGNRILLNEPADPTASPFGWHDTDGVAGAEFTITRGNNVIASEDRDADNIPGYSPDGGANLNFDFTVDSNLPPSFNEDAAITNLFVWNNYTHDVWFNHGFNEASGNFQETNYSGQGTGNDFVVADAQDGAGLNNANFGTPPEGFNPRMQMFLWSPPGPPSDPLTINTPSDIAGDYFGPEADFGPVLTPTPITSDLVLVSDDNSSTSTDPHDACDPITNAAALNGKIVVINRGDCFFTEKIEAAQNNGALAVIMINNVFGNPISMSGDGSNVTIPSIMISLTDGSPILSKLQNGDTINATLVNNGPFEIDGDYDNGIIAHEYGHGISNRLTGGAQQSNCLFNDEQMGEGWSDWIGLMMTIQPGDTPELPRGYGTFAISQPTTGSGIRPARYTTDTSVNPATYGLTNNLNISQPHGVGFVWATMLWDLTWELIDQYGFDPDFINGNGGNNLAMELVIDGMKLQSCNPGFIDGRDAILQADMLSNNGNNQCYIWKVFANRGLGFSANQGSPFDREDQTEAFDLPPNITLPCESLAVQDFNENSLKLYPNPADDILNIETLAGTIGNANLKIFDLSGRLLMNKALDFNQNQSINLSELSHGVYIVKIENTRVDISKKLIVN